jgi:hypothetical protein
MANENNREYQNNILASLGFSRIIGDKHRHVSEKKYNIRNDKLVQLFIKNVDSGPFAEFMIGSSKVHKFYKNNYDSLAIFRLLVVLTTNIIFIYFFNTFYFSVLINDLLI